MTRTDDDDPTKLTTDHASTHPVSVAQYHAPETVRAQLAAAMNGENLRDAVSRLNKASDAVDAMFDNTISRDAIRLSAIPWDQASLRDKNDAVVVRPYLFDELATEASNLARFIEQNVAEVYANLERNSGTAISIGRDMEGHRGSK